MARRLTHCVSDTISRRAFLAVSALAPAMAAPAPKCHGLAEKQPVDSAYGGFKLGIASYSLRQYDLAATIGHIADLGLHWVEFFGGHVEATLDGERISEVRGLLEPHGIRMNAYWAGDPSGDEAQNRFIFEFAKLSGILLLTGHPLPESYPVLNTLVQEFDIKIGIHNHGPGHIYDTVDDMLEAAAPWDARIGFCLDTGHCMRSGENPVEAVRRLGGRLYGLHLKDHEHIGRDEPPQTILGEGALDLDGLCTALRDIGFDAPISVEYDRTVTPDEIRRGNEHFANAAQR